MHFPPSPPPLLTCAFFTMTTTELNPVNVSHNRSSLSEPEPPKIDKGSLITSVVDNLTLEDAAMAKSQKHDCKDTSFGEHGANDNHSPPSPRERLGRSPMPTGNLKDLAGLGAAMCSSRSHQPYPNQRLPPTAKIGGQGPSTMASQRPGDTTTRPQERVNDPFSLSGLPSLQTFIPPNLFPDELLNHDPHNITKLRRHKSQSTSNVPVRYVRYVRVFPNFKEPRDPVLPYKLRFSTDLKRRGTTPCRPTLRSPTGPRTNPCASHTST